MDRPGNETPVASESGAPVLVAGLPADVLSDLREAILHQRVEEARSGRQALRVLSEGTWTAVILGPFLPGLSPLYVLDTLARLQGDTRPPVLLCLGGGPDDSAATMLAAMIGGVTVLAPPLSAREIVDAVQRVGSTGATAGIGHQAPTIAPPSPPRTFHPTAPIEERATTPAPPVAPEDDAPVPEVSASDVPVPVRDAPVKGLADHRPTAALTESAAPSVPEARIEVGARPAPVPRPEQRVGTETAPLTRLPASRRHPAITLFNRYEHFLWPVLFVIAAAVIGAIWSDRPGSTISLMALVIAPALLIIRRWPLLVPLFLLFILYTRISDVGITYHNLPSVAQPFVILMVAVALVRHAPGGATRYLWLQIRQWGAMALYLAVIIASTIWAQDGSAALAQASDLAKNFLIVFIMIELFDRPPSLRMAVWALIGAGTFLAMLSVFQAVTHTFGSTYWGLAQAPVRQITLTSNAERAGGPMGDPNFYALILVSLVPLAVFRIRDEPRWLERFVAAGCVLFLMGGIILTYSRGALLTLALVLIPMVPLARIPMRRIVVGLVCLLPLAALVPGEYWSRLALLLPGSGGSATEDPAVAARLGSEVTALDMFQQHPIFGVGAANYQFTYLPYAIKLNVPNAAAVPHDLYLQIAAETGVLGLATFGLAMGLILWAGWKATTRARSSGDRIVEGLAASSLLSFAAFLVGSAFLPNAYPRYLWMFVGLVLASAIMVRTRARGLFQEDRIAEAA